MKNSTTRIAEKNDLFRTTFIPFLGKLVLTEGVQKFRDKDEILSAVRSFDSFTSDNDPYQEHDFGKFEVSGKSYFWKIDYYDANYELFQEDGRRILTIMHASEYLKGALKCHEVLRGRICHGGSIARNHRRKD